MANRAHPKDPYSPPRADATRQSRASRRELRFDSVRITAWTYSGWLSAAAATAFQEGAQQPFEVRSLQVVMLLLVALGAWSATRRARIGFVVCYLLSALLLPFVGIGTVLGFNMLLALRRNRAEFFVRKR
jgi:hypothetical protein